MEKISLKPVAKEILHKAEEPNTHFDVLSYEGSNNQEKALGSLFLIGHIKYDEEDLGYMVSLVSSLARREYYSEQSIKGQDSKKAFENTLKKLNEVLEDFFNTKKFNLNIGLLAISSDMLYISRLGKFKVALARNNDYIDVLNNISLFHKSDDEDSQFSNIISGKIQAGDKIFAYFPARPITAREKTLNGLFVAESQTNFVDRLAQLASNTDTFSCCGVHITIEQVKEIAVQAPVYTRSAYRSAGTEVDEAMATPTVAAVSGLKIKPSMNADIDQAVPLTTVQSAESDVSPTAEPIAARSKSATASPPIAQAKVIPAEVSMTKRSNFLSDLASKLSGAGTNTRMNSRKKIVIGSLAAIIVIIGAVLFFSFHESASTKAAKAAYATASENVKMAQEKIDSDDVKGGRALLESTLESIHSNVGQNFDALRNTINSKLAAIDHLNEVKALPFYGADEASASLQFTGIEANKDSLYGISPDATIYNITSGKPEKVEQLAKSSSLGSFLHDGSSLVSYISPVLSRYDVDKKKVTNVKFSDKNTQKASTYLDSIVFGDNLYVITADTIYKYDGALLGKDSLSKWNKVTPGGDVMFKAIAADGNIYALMSNDEIVTYYKGEQKTTSKLSFTPGDHSKLITNKDIPSAYIFDGANQKIYVLDKSTFELTKTYKLTGLGTILDLAVSSSGTIWGLSQDSKIWKIQ